MKRVLLFFVAVTFAAFSFAQDADTLKPWKIYGLGSLSINQASFSNWSAGGDNSFSGTALLKLYSDYAKDKSTWNTVLNMKYGMIKSGDGPVEKNDDLIELISQYNYEIAKKWRASAQLNFTTQFAEGYENPGDDFAVSKFMAPGYLTFTPGVTYQPVEYFSILMSPVTPKAVFVLDQDLANLGAYGVDGAVYDTAGLMIEEGKTSKFKFGAFVEFYFKKELKTDLSLESRLNAFYNYLQDESIPENAVPVDVNWQTFFNYTLNKWMSVSLFLHLAYQPGDVIITTDAAGVSTATPNDKLQVQETLGIGLTYNF
jgi:hypothetical protein